MIDDLEARLRWQYGPERAADIVAGLDPETEHDRAAWEAIGDVVPANPLATTALLIARGVLADVRTQT